MTTLSKVWPVKLLAVVILVLFVAACGRDKEAEATPTAAPAANVAAPTATPAAAAAAPTVAPEATAVVADTPAAEATSLPQSNAAIDISDDPQIAVTNAISAMSAGGPYRAVTSVDSGGTVTQMTAEVVPPNKMHIIIGGGNLELILLDGTLWSKTNGANWAQMGSPEMMQSIFDSINGQVAGATFTNVQLVGAEPVLGVPTNVYTFTSTFGEGDQAITSDVKLWVSKETGLPVRMEANGTAAGVATHTIQTIEYDDTIDVVAPAQ